MPQQAPSRSSSLRPPVWLLVAIFLAAALPLALSWASPIESLVLAGVGLAAALAGSLARRSAELELKQEIERRKQAEQEARAANQVKSEFLANMSHELRTPLGAIIGSADLLLGAKLAEAERRHVEVIDNSAEFLLALINDVLDFAKLEAGQLRLELCDVHLRELAEGVRDMVARKAEEKQLELVLEVDPSLPAALRSDHARLRQVLINLVNNAVKFTDEGRVSLRITDCGSAEHGPRIRFAVSDTGIGISPEDQARIFETFYQAERTSIRRFGGSGIGLAISRQLVRRMGGEIGLESEHGVGSTFWFWVPLEAVEVAPTPPEAGGPTPVLSKAERERFRVLVVDDEMINRRLAVAHLSVLGYQAEAVDSGGAALERFSEAFDVVLMDCQMPELDGYEAARRWRRLEAEHAGARTLLVALTASALPGERDKSLAVGMDAHLTKPYRGEDLQQILDPWLQARAE